MHTTRTSQSSSEPVIRTSGLTKRFGTRVAVAAATLEVPRGCAFGFLGPNGAGKTTLIRTLLGLTPASGGTMELLGLPVPERRAEALARVGAIVDEPSFHGHLTGRENLWIAAAVRDPAAVARIAPSLERMGLLDRADDRVATYSMGMRQRLGISRCLLADPELLILDEPTNGLDPGGILEFRRFVRGLVDEGRTVFLSSHLLDEVEKVCDAAAIVDGGRVLMQGTISEIATDGNLMVDVECSDHDAAVRALGGLPVLTAITRTADGLRLTVAGDDRRAIPGVTRALVAAGIDVYRISPARRTLEERFLELTTTLGAVA
jgi:ABC-2 type transport system ATP-binding protein